MTLVDSAWTTWKTLLLTASLLLQDTLNELLPSDGPHIVDLEAFFGCCGNVFTGHCIAMDAFFGSMLFWLSAVTSHYIKTFCIV
jgi:hypothetical protein